MTAKGRRGRRTGACDHHVLPAACADSPSGAAVDDGQAGGQFRLIVSTSWTGNPIRPWKYLQICGLGQLHFPIKATPSSAKVLSNSPAFGFIALTVPRKYPGRYTVMGQQAGQL